MAGLGDAVGPSGGMGMGGMSESAGTVEGGGGGDSGSRYAGGSKAITKKPKKTQTVVTSTGSTVQPLEAPPKPAPAGPTAAAALAPVARSASLDWYDVSGVPAPTTYRRQQAPVSPKAAQVIASGYGF